MWVCPLCGVSPGSWQPISVCRSFGRRELSPSLLRDLRFQMLPPGATGTARSLVAGARSVCWAVLNHGFFRNLREAYKCPRINYNSEFQG